MPRYIMVLIVACCFTVSQSGYAEMDCDSTDDYIRVTDDTSLDCGTGCSWGAWVIIDAAGEQNIIDHRGRGCAGVDQGGYMLRVQDAAFPLKARCIIHRDNCLVGNEQSLDADTVAQSTWTHLACTFNNTTDTMKVYVNGVEAASSAAITNDPSSNPATTDLIICDHSSFEVTPPTSTNFNGRVSDPYFTQTVLSAQDMANIGKSRVKRMPLQYAPKMYLPLDECGDGATCTGTDLFKDLSGNGNDGTPSGSPVGSANQVLTYP